MKRPKLADMPQAWLETLVDELLRHSTELGADGEHAIRRALAGWQWDYMDEMTVGNIVRQRGGRWSTPMPPEMSSMPDWWIRYTALTLASHAVTQGSSDPEETRQYVWDTLSSWKIGAHARLIIETTIGPIADGLPASGAIEG